MNKKAMILMVGGLIFCLTGACLAKMSAQQVINQMRGAYDQRMSGIDDLTMITKGTAGIMAMMGESTIYQKRAEIAGKTVYKTRTEIQFMGKPLITIYDGEYEWSVDPISGQVKKENKDFVPDWTRIWEVLDLSQMQYVGTDDLDGETAHVLKMDDLTEGIKKLMPVPPQAGPSKEGEWSGWAKMWINAKNWVFMRMQIVMTGTSEEGKEMTNRITSDFKDYHQVQTMLIPHQMTYKMEVEIPDMSPEEKQMMLGMMGAFMEGEMIVTKVEVNTGLPADLFDGTKLEAGEPMFKIPEMPQE